MNRLNMIYTNNEEIDTYTKVFKAAHNSHRSQLWSLRNKQDSQQNCLISNAVSPFKSIKSARTTTRAQIPQILIGDKKYAVNLVADELFKILLNLISVDYQELANSPHHESLMEDQENIQQRCANKLKLPIISMEKIQH